MSLLSLQDIGKIYVSGNNVAVGIRGVNLSFDRGEFVAITGKSGSGKSTLLNVISGMDSYEEGEMFVAGEPTSHYVQSDWEEYRAKYISFIFQDYNIIESFTVLQNVELALMHIADPKERRARALELLHRVGLEKHIRHKGSKLSGGQKQRTVIARALAKDSPVILADEPTGNLDSQSSKEIIKLLREVSKDKLVIIVTHNFEQVEDYATRHIRVFDNAIESDQVISSPDPSVAAAEEAPVREGETAPLTGAPRFRRNLREGFTLGAVRFRATPKLSVFLCILMILSSLAMTLITSLNGGAVVGLFEKNYIVTHKTGRVVIIRQDGAVITDGELESLVTYLGADSALHYDFLLDRTQSERINDKNYDFAFSYGEFGKIDAGRAPAADNEILLRVPVSLRPYFGTDGFTEKTLVGVFGIADYKVVGVDYYYDNTVKPQMVFTESGYRTASALAYFANSLTNFHATVTVGDNQTPASEAEMTVSGSAMRVSFAIGADSYYINTPQYRTNLATFEETKMTGGIPGYDYSVTTSLTGSFTDFRYGDDDDDWTVEVDIYDTENEVTSALGAYTLLSAVSESVGRQMNEEGWQILLSPEIVVDFMEAHYYTSSYTQASLFFSSDREAGGKVAELKERGYVALLSSSVEKEDSLESLITTLALLVEAIGWALAVVFIALFLSLCSTRAMLATKGDIAILRSMGIPTPVIRISIYIQTLIALAPAYLITAVTAVLIFTIPQTNALFAFLHSWEYLLIAVALLAINLLLSKRYVKKMFGTSVKKTLKGDAEA